MQYGAKAFDDVQAHHRARHSSFGQEFRGIAPTAEIFAISRHPSRSVEASLCFVFCDLPERFHHRLSFLVALLAGAVEGRRSGIDQVDDSLCRFAGQLFTGYTQYGFGTPVRSDVGKELRRIRQQIAEQHGCSVERVVLGGQNEWRADTAPVV